MIIDDNGQHFATRTRVAKKNLTFFREAGRGKALVQVNNYVKFSPGLILLMGEEGSGRSRVLKQFADGFKDKQGKICILAQAIKNEEQLYGAIAEGFDIDVMSGENLQTLQRAMFSFLEKNTENSKPVIVALDDTHQCSLAALEALIALRAKFKTMSLILVGDNGLQKMLQRLQGGKVTASTVVLAPLDAREVRQYINWRIDFQLPDLALANIVNVSRGNIGLLEKEVLKQEIIHRQKSTHQSGNGFLNAIKISRGMMLSLLIAALMTAGAYLLYFIYWDRVFSSVSMAVRPPPPVVRSNQEWVVRQEVLLTGNAIQ